MYNLGIDPVVEAGPALNWSEEQLFELDSMLDTQITAVINLCVVGESIQKYGKTKQLNELVGASLESAGITFSNEGMWDGIKDVFKWIWEKLTDLWNWFTGLFKSDAAAEAKADNAIKAAEKQMATDGTSNEMVEIVDTKPIIEAVAELNRLSDDIVRQQEPVSAKDLIIDVSSGATIDDSKLRALSSAVEKREATSADNIKKIEAVEEKIKNLLAGNLPSRRVYKQRAIAEVKVLSANVKQVGTSLVKVHDKVKVLRDSVGTIVKDINTVYTKQTHKDGPKYAKQAAKLALSKKREAGRLARALLAAKNREKALRDKMLKTVTE